MTALDDLQDACEGAIAAGDDALAAPYAAFNESLDAHLAKIVEAEAMIPANRALAY